MHRTPILAEYRQIYPGESRLVSGAPDHISYVQKAIVREQRQSVPDSHDSRHPLDPSIDQIAWFNAHQRCGPGKHLRTRLAAHRSAHGQDVVTDESYQPRKKHSSEETVDRKRNMARFFPGNPGPMRTRDIHANICSRVSDSYNQDIALLQL